MCVCVYLTGVLAVLCPIGVYMGVVTELLDDVMRDGVTGMGVVIRGVA